MAAPSHSTETLEPRDRESSIPAPRARRLTMVYGPKGALAPVISPIADAIVVGRDPGSGGFAVPDDSALSRKHFELRPVPEYSGLLIRDLESKNKLWVDGQPADRGYVRGGSVIRAGACLFVIGELPEGTEKWADPVDISRPDRADPRTSLTRTFAELVADEVAKSELSVLIYGPTGAGKELLAQRIHDGSGRKGRLLAINCGAFNRDLLSAELFGYVEGIHSTALRDKAGIFEEAQGGSIFLDEIGDMPIEQQPVLLRVLQEKKVRRIGGHRDIPIDVRVIAATHRNLGELEGEGHFRGDLLARLAGARIFLPGLDQRREEILSLISHFLGPSHPAITIAAGEALLLYDWPYNVREIREVANAIRLMPKLDVVDETVLPPAIRDATRERSPPGPPSRDELARHLERVQGNVTRLARELGEHRTQIQRWLKGHGLDPADYRSGEK